VPVKAAFNDANGLNGFFGGFVMTSFEQLNASLKEPPLLLEFIPHQKERALSFSFSHDYISYPLGAP
jgi:hypothetical protein